MRVCFVVQRYGLEINGGAELHCRWVAEHMAKHWEVEVVTTQAYDYVTWNNHYPETETVVNGIPVRRFPVKRPRSPERFGRIQNYIFENEHREEDELAWLEEEGPLAPGIIDYVRSAEGRIDYFVFFSYRYYHSFYGIRAVPAKSILVPTAERDPVVHLRIFKDLFRLPRAFVYNSHEERAMIQGLSRNEAIPGDVVGVGTEVPDSYDGARFRAKFGVEAPYVIYVGRIDENKGCHKLFEHFLRFKAETGSPAQLLLVGNTILPIPGHPDVRHLGFLSEQDKFDGIAGADALMMPSFYESLSMVTLEAWAMGKPVLANAACDVLQGQCRRSNGGLYYESYPEFREALALLLGDAALREALGRNGRAYFNANYTWDIIENKYLAIVAGLEQRRP
jgi:glycosyltransferase involved in cell wall biosynthesis